MSLLFDLHSINRHEQELEEIAMVKDTAIHGVIRKKQKKENGRRVKEHIERMDKEKVSCTFIPREGYLVLQQEKGRKW